MIESYSREEMLRKAQHNMWKRNLKVIEYLEGLWKLVGPTIQFVELIDMINEEVALRGLEPSDQNYVDVIRDVALSIDEDSYHELEERETLAS